MAHIACIPTRMTAAEFLATDQRSFGPAWRYELIDGQIVGLAAPSPKHGRILAGLMRALSNRLSGNRNGCYPEAGSGAAPGREQKNTARIPDAIVRREDLPRIAFDIISPSELKDWQARDKKREDIQDIEGLTEIVEIYEDQFAMHVFRKDGDGNWNFCSLGKAASVLTLFGAGDPLNIPLSEIYEFASAS